MDRVDVLIGKGSYGLLTHREEDELSGLLEARLRENGLSFAVDIVQAHLRETQKGDRDEDI